MRIFVTLFLGTVRPRRLIFGTHVDKGQLYRVYQNRVAATYSSIYFFIFLSLQFSNIEIFRHFLFQELWSLEGWNFVYTWAMGRCIMCIRISLLLLIHPFISSFFFLSNFQTLKFSVTLFPGTVRPRRLKLGTHVDSGQMYCVYRNQAAAAYSSLYCFIFLSLQFSSLHSFDTFFSRSVRPRRLKLCTHMDSGQMYPVYQN